MKKINFAYPIIGEIEKKNILKAINSRWLAKGTYIEKLEKKFCQVLKSKYSIAVNNGTSAMLLILMHLKIKTNDEIIVPSFCYISPIHMIKLIGALPIVADVNLKTFQIDYKKVEEKISKRTKAILMVHNFGGLCDCENIYKIAQKYNLTIIEDFSESLLSKFNNKFLGGQQKNSKLKIISFSSLHATKTITTGEGGIITTNSQKTCFNIKNLRDHGINKYKAYHYKQIGGNFRLSNILAAMGYSQLSRVNQIIKKKREINNLYIKNLKNIEGIKLQKDLIESDPIKWGFPVRLHNSFYVKKIIRELNKINIKTMPAFISFNKFKYLKIYYNKKNNKSDFKNSELLQNSLVVLPLNLKLTKNDIIFICKNIKKILGNYK